MMMMMMLMRMQLIEIDEGGGMPHRVRLLQ